MLEILLISCLGLAVAISIAAAIAPSERPWLADARAHPWPFARAASVSDGIAISLGDQKGF